LPKSGQEERKVPARVRSHSRATIGLTTRRWTSPFIAAQVLYYTRRVGESALTAAERTKHGSTQLLWTLAGIAWTLVVSFLVLCPQRLPGQVAATAGEPKPGVSPGA
jgi:hypothetical protein